MSSPVAFLFSFSFEFLFDLNDQKRISIPNVLRRFGPFRIVFGSFQAPNVAKSLRKLAKTSRKFRANSRDYYPQGIIISENPLEPAGDLEIVDTWQPDQDGDTGPGTDWDPYGGDDGGHSAADGTICGKNE